MTNGVESTSPAPRQPINASSGNGPLFEIPITFLLRLVEICIFIAAILIIVLCIGEIAARTGLQAQIQQELNDTSDFLARNITPDTTQLPSTRAISTSDFDPSRPEQLQLLRLEDLQMARLEQLERTRNTITGLRALLVRVRLLQSVGSIADGELSRVSDRFSMTAADLSHADSEGVAGIWLIDDLASWIGRQNSEILLAIIVCLGGLVGSLIAGFRTAAGTIHRDVPLGIAAGFVVYLAIKGGKFVFLLQTQDTSFAMNPYGCVFAGLLAGLFTEKAYELLTALIDELSRRLTKVVASESTSDRQ